jgi:small subunit ribosomal protein S8
MTINNMLNSIRQAYVNKKKHIILPRSKMGICILKILCQHGFLRAYIFQNASVKVLLKYNKGKSVINSLNTSQIPPVYLSAENLSRSYHKELLILTTSRGIYTSNEARQQGIGGYLLFSIL